MKKRNHNFINRTGETHIVNGGYRVEIIEYFNASNCTLRYDDGVISYKVCYANLLKGLVRKPDNRVGEIHYTNEGYPIEIIKYNNSNNCTIKFLDTELILTNLQYGNIRNGEVGNPYHKSVCGVGYLGIGKYPTSINGKKTPTYIKWAHMISRCYSEVTQYPTYKDVTVCEEWHNFQNFASWFEEKYKSNIMEEWCLDKDILVKSNKIYSPGTCCFAPHIINCLFVKSDKVRGKYPIGVYFSKIKGKFKANITINGDQYHLGYFDLSEEAFQAYKFTKEAWIKEVAEIWKGQIEDCVYQTLINYQVEITD